MNFEPIMPQYGSCLADESRLTGSAEGIFFPKTSEEAAQAVCITAENHEKLTLQGARTGLSGGAVPNGGMVLNLSELTQLGEVLREADGSATVWAQCGVTLETLAAAAESQGLIFPPNPTEPTATLGGLFATGAEGTNALFYGSVSRYVEELDWLTPTGERWRISRGAFLTENGKLPLPNGKILNLSDFGHLPVPLADENGDLIDFLSGTEGYFGTALAMKLRLVQPSQEIWGIVFFFAEEANALAFARELLPFAEKNGDAWLTTAEFYDRGALKLLNHHRENPMLAKLTAFPAEGAAVYLELEGTGEDAATELLMTLLNLFEANGGGEAESWAENGRSAIRPFRDMRHAVPSILGELPDIRPEGKSRWEMDAAGKKEDFPKYLEEYRQVLREFSVPGAIYGHLLTNKLHVALLPENETQKSACPEIMTRLGAFAMENGGFVTDGYGVGKVKRPLLLQFLSPQDKALLRDLRRSFDPEERMNP